MQNVKKVVAAPGYQVLLEISGRKIVVSAFNAVDLAEMFSEEDLNKCAGLIDSLNHGYLLEYTDQSLPSDPNEQYISELRFQAAQHIQTNYKQAGSNLDKRTQMVTSPDEMTDEFKQDLLDRVEKSKAEILNTAESLLDHVKNDAYVDIDREPKERGNPLTANELTMKVSMDIPVEKFVAKQEADAIALEESRKDSPMPTDGVSHVVERSNNDIDN